MFLHVRPSRLAGTQAGQVVVFNKVLKSWYGAWTPVNQYSDSPGCFPSMVRTNGSPGKLSQSSVDGGPCPGTGCHWMSWGLRIGAAEAKQTCGTKQDRKQNNCKSSATTHSHVKLSRTSGREAGRMSDPLGWRIFQACSTLHCPFYVLVNIL